MNDWGRELQWNAIAYAMVAAGGVLAILGLWLYFPGLRARWLPLPRLRPGRWAGYDVFLAFCVEIGFPALIVLLLVLIGFFTPLIGSPPDQNAPKVEQTVYSFRARNISSPLALTVTLGMILAMMFARAGARPQQYGLSWARGPANIALGIAAFVVARPVIIGIFALAVLVYQDESQALKRFGQQNPPAWEWLLFGFQTTIAAAILEEILFRGLLQGWLRRASLIGHALALIWTMFLAADALVSVDAQTKAVSIHWSALAPIAAAGLGIAGYVFWMSRLRREFDLTDEEFRDWQVQPRGMSLEPGELTEEQTAQKRRELRTENERRSQRWADANAKLAILGSALLFAVFHPWPGALALFPMGLLLGWLSWRTQSLVGPITFHALFNLTTFIAFYGSVLTAPR
ncbi:MAG: CPBP family intramembrane metalloprotease [Planctomycetes bacterium]|nr:CPBP family intramembrane metalloprotease [Planctomycetota bacterium]